MTCGIFLNRGQTRVSCVDRLILYHWATGEAPHLDFCCSLLTGFPLLSSLKHSSSNGTLKYFPVQNLPVAPHHLQSKKPKSWTDQALRRLPCLQHSDLISIFSPATRSPPAILAASFIVPWTFQVCAHRQTIAPAVPSAWNSLPPRPLPSTVCFSQHLVWMSQSRQVSLLGYHLITL